MRSHDQLLRYVIGTHEYEFGSDLFTRRPEDVIQRLKKDLEIAHAN